MSEPKYEWVRYAGKWKKAKKLLCHCGAVALCRVGKLGYCSAHPPTKL